MYRSVTTTERKLCDNQSQSPHLSGVNRAALGGVDAGGNDAGVAENVRKAAQVFFQRVKGAGEQVRRLCGNTLFGFTFIQVECADFRFKNCPVEQ